MTTITIYKTNTGNYKGFLCNGHAGFAVSGSDIVCASISVLVINTINSVETLVSKEETEVVTNEKRGMISFQLKKIPHKDTTLLLDSLVLGLQEMEKKYGNKYLKLKFEEV